MNCDTVEVQIIEYVNGALPRDVAKELEEHLNDCPKCQRLHVLLQQVRSPNDPEAERDWGELLAGVDKLTDELVTTAQELLARREMGAAAELFHLLSVELASLDPEVKNALPILNLYCQWLDSGGYTHAGMAIDVAMSNLNNVETAIRKFVSTNDDLRVSDQAHIWIVQGLVALIREEYDEALGKLAMAADVRVPLHPATVAYTRNAIARCYRKKQDFRNAKQHSALAIAITLEAGYAELAAVFQLTYAWACFELNEGNPAALFNAAIPALDSVHDRFNIGNALSALGRITRRAGPAHYCEAKKLFEKALVQYSECDAVHGNIARVYTSIAFTKRLMAKELGNDADALRSEASYDLQRAEDIYASHKQHRGVGMCYVYSAYLLIDIEDFRTAAKKARTAFELGRENKDEALMARARIVQTLTSTLSNGTEKAAMRLGRSAVAHAKRALQNRRLLARSYIAYGLAAVNTNNVGLAAHACRKATKLLNPRERDYVFQDLEALKARISSNIITEPLSISGLKLV